jgi:predicted transcriptional regulator
MLPHTTHALCRAILLDLRVGQSTADSIAPRIGINTQTAERICQHLLSLGHVESHLIGNRLTVYRATAEGLQILL